MNVHPSSFSTFITAVFYTDGLGTPEYSPAPLLENLLFCISNVCEMWENVLDIAI